MNKIETKKAVVSFLVAAVVLVSVVGTASAATQEWYLRFPNYGGEVVNDGYLHSCDKTMSKTPGSVSRDMAIRHYPGGDWEVAWWYAEDPAECDLSFGSGNWKAFVDYENNGNYTETLYIQIFKVDTEGNAVALTEEYQATGLTTGELDNASYTLTSTADHSIKKGERFAVRFRWDKDSGNFFEIQYDNVKGTLSSTRILSPETEPGYPTPELPTLVLFGTGLLALAGFVLYNRRKEDRK